jgi:hypothetical protein
VTETADQNIVHAQRRLWEKKLRGHDNLIQAVGSESTEHKELRYTLVSKVFEENKTFSLLDVGAGVGDYYGFLKQSYPDRKISYLGIDLVQEFRQLAEQRYPGIKMSGSDVLSEDVGRHDYVVMSGLFHQRGDCTEVEWSNFMHRMLEKAFAISNEGIVFNMISHHAEFRREGNFYVNVGKIVDWVTSKLSRFYWVCHASPLYEATIAVYKSDVIRRSYPSTIFARYIK